MTDQFEKLNGNEEELTEKQLKWGYWLTVNRPNFYKGLIIFLIVFNVLLGGYNLYYWGNYLIFGYSEDQKMLVDLRSNVSRSANLLERFSAKSLTVGGVTSFAVGDKIDALALISNPNSSFIANIEYTFLLNGQTVGRRQSFVLPGENKYLAELGIKGGGSIGFNLVKVSWQRISSTKINNPASFKDTHLQFEVFDFKYANSGFYRVSFNLKNSSVYNFYRAEFLILLKNYENIVGVEKIVVDNFQSEEVRPIEVVVSSGINPNSLQLVPNINVFDDSVYSR